MSDIRERLLAAFQIEHKEHIQAVRAMLHDLDRRQYDPQAFDLIESHRRVHSLKGAARAVGLRPVEVLAHGLESLMSRCQAGTLELDRKVGGIIRQALDEIEDCAAAFANGRRPEGTLGSLRAIERLIGGADPGTADRDTAAGTKTSRQASASADESRAGDIGAEPDTSPPRLAERTVDVGGAARVEDTARINVANLDSVLRHAVEVLTEMQYQEVVSKELRQLRGKIVKLERDVAKIRVAPRQLTPPDFTNQDTTRAEFDLAPMIGEISVLASHITRSQREAIWRLRKVGLELHSGVRALRIVPAESAFSGIRKMARDLAREEGKQVEVEVSGLQTLVDRRVLQALKDPVMHLLRNAIHHGIESPEERTRHNKAAAGRIAFSIATDRGRLLLRLEDDGRGLNRERVLKEAHRLGLLHTGEPAPDDFRSLTRILVRPNFTTSANITEISGRGIGLSVVDMAVRQLQGAFELRPGEDGGTVALISVPLTVSGSRLLLAHCRSQTYGIPVQWLERLYRISTEEIITIKDEPNIRADGLDVPVALVSLAQLLGHKDTAVNDSGGVISVVLLKVDDARLAIAVDALGSVQDGVIHDLDTALSQSDLVSGGTILNDGSAALVLNPPALVMRAEESSRQWSVNSRSADEELLPPLILVVDDSITTRTLERSILEAKGYRVLLSVDGLDALDVLRQQSVDLLIVDVEMPRMDGFDLLHTMKQDEQLMGIPVILVTSRDNPQDRRRGLALGAEAYIIKQRFDQRELLTAIEQIL